MKKYILLSFIALCFLSFNFPPKAKKINLVINTKSASAINLDYIEKNFNHEDFAGIFIYEVKEDPCCDYPSTEVYFKGSSLGVIYGIPNKDFLQKILPVLEDQILEIDRIEKIRSTLDK
jgi:hypothetical protein